MKPRMLPICAAIILVPAVCAAADDVGFSADGVVYDKNTGKMSTVGPVSIEMGRNRIGAASVEFDTATGDLGVPGQIDMVGPDSRIDTLGMAYNTRTGDGRIGETNVEFGENSFARADSAELVGDEKIVLNHAEYTACKEGLRGCGDKPTWSLYANRITNYLDDGRLLYSNALLYIWDTPVFYLPFFMNYIPSVENKSGLMAPSVGTSGNLGYIYQQPVFFKLGKYNDMTLTPMFTSQQGPLFIGEYRTNQDIMESVTAGSFKEKSDTEDKRWHVKSRSYFEFDGVWRAFANIERASDDTYLRLYDFNTDPWLLTQFGLEGVSGRSYLTAYSYSYQDLRALPDAYTPQVLPIVNYRRISEPFGGGGFFDLNLNGARIVRDYSDPAVLNEGELRTSAILKYTQPLRFDSGHLLDLGLSLRGDLYSLDDIQTGDPAAPMTYTGTKSRTNAAASAMWRYPMYRSFGNRTELLEPTIQVISSQRQRENANAVIPNMDSKYMELEVENLFSDDRFSGYDVFESGTRFNYGVKFSQEYAGGQGMSFFIGQNFNANVPDDIYLANSGLANGSGFSDIVASLVYSPSSRLRLGYKSRMDDEKFKINRNDVNLYAGTPALNLTVNYVYLRNMYIEGDLPVRKDEINAYLRSQLTRRWSVYFGNRYDLYQDRDIALLGGLAYENDCFKWSVSFINEFTRDRDYVGDKAVYLSLTFRTLGTVSTGFGIGTESRNNSADSGSAASASSAGI